MELQKGLLYNDDGTPYRDVLYGTIPAEQLHVDLINTGSFRRMGNILQNGFSYIDFPNMVSHHRLGHSIGAFHKTGLILNSEKRRNVIHPSYQKIARVSALLHDIGHAPLSHAMEPFIGMNHEARTKQIIESDTDVNRVLVKHGFTDEDIRAITIKTGFMGKVLDGSIDIDKQDYLPRDAHYAGRKLGTDFNNIEKALIIAFNEQGDPEVCIDKKYLMDVDQMISERRWMYQNIYFSDAPMAAESSLLPLLTEYVPYLVENGHITAKGLDPVFEKVIMGKDKLSLSEFQGFDEQVWKRNIESLAGKDDKVLRYMFKQNGESAVRDFTVSYTGNSRQDAYKKKLLKTFNNDNAKSFGLTQRTAKYRTYKEGGIRVAYPNGQLQELADESASLRESADTEIVDRRICENPTLIQMELDARTDSSSAFGKFLLQAQKTKNDIER